MIDFTQLRETIKQYIVENKYFSDYDIDINDIVQFAIDILSYTVQNLNVQIDTQLNDVLLYSSQNPDIIINLLPLFGYIPNFGKQQNGKINLYLTSDEQNQILQNTTLYNNMFQLSTKYNMIPKNTNIKINTPIYNLSTGNTTNVSLNYIILDDVYLDKNDLDSSEGKTNVTLKLLSGDTYIPIIQQELKNITYSNIDGTPFSKYLIIDDISQKTLIINQDINYNPYQIVNINNKNITYPIYSSILSQKNNEDFLLLSYEPSTMKLYVQSGDDYLNGKKLEDGQELIIYYYETYGNRISFLSNTLNSNINITNTINGTNYSFKIQISQPNKLYSGKLYKNINEIKKDQLILGNINNKILTKQNYIDYQKYYLRNNLSYNYVNVNVISNFGYNRIDIIPLVSEDDKIYHLKYLEQWEQNLFQNDIQSISPITTYVKIINPILYYIQTKDDTQIIINVKNNIKFNEIVTNLKLNLDSYFNINNFPLFDNFDIIDFISNINKLEFIKYIDYDSVIKSLVIEDENNNIVNIPENNNTIIQLPNTVTYSQLSLKNIKFKFIDEYNTELGSYIYPND